MSIELFRPSNATHGEFFHEEFNRERREKRSDIISTDRLEAAGQIRPGLITRI